MFYELTATLKTLREEGAGSLAKKLVIYFSQLLSSFRFALARRPRAERPEAVVDFAMNVAGGLIRPAQVRSEMVELAQIVGEKRPRVVVEIGTAMGGTLFAFATLADPGAIIVSIDLPNGIHGGGYPYWKTFLYRSFASSGQQIHLLRGSSHDATMLAELRRILGGRPIDFLFIDGDHTYAGVKQDYEMYAPLVPPGGLVAFHDIAVHPPELECHVDRYWNEVKAGRTHREVIENRQQGNCGIGLIFP